MTLTELIKTVKRLDSEMKSGPKVVEHVSPEVSNMAYHKMRMVGLTALPKLAAICALQAEALEFYANKESYDSDDTSRTSGNKTFDIVCFDFDRNLEPRKDFAGKRAREALAKVQEVCDE